LFAGTLAWSGFLALRTVLDSTRSQRVAEELLEDPDVRLQLATNIADAIGVMIPPGVEVQPAVLESAALMVLDAPATRQVVAVALMQTHAAFLGEAPLPRGIDVGEVSQLARQALVQLDPRLDLVLPAAPDVLIELPTDRIPNAGPLRNALRALVPILAVVAAVGEAVALLTSTDQAGVMRRAGTWAVSSAAFVLIVTFGGPWLIGRFAPDQAEVLGALITALLGAARTPALVLGATGLGALGLSVAWSVGGRGRRSDSSAADPEGAVEPSRLDRDPVASTPGTQRPSGDQESTSVVTATPLSPLPPTPPIEPALHTGVISAEPSPPAVKPAAEPAPAEPADWSVESAPRGVVPARPPQAIPLADTGQLGSGGVPGLATGTGDPVDNPLGGASPPPKWIPGIGFVQHPDDARPPEGARWEPGVGYVLDGPDDPFRET